MRHRAVMIGAGGIANAWQQRFLPPFAERLAIAALVDVRRDVLDAAADRLGVSAEARFTEMHAAFAAVPCLGVDCCIIAIPPAFHKEAALGAMAAGLAILSEKPVADTWESAVDIYRAAKTHGRRMQIIQNYREDPNIRTLKSVLDTGRLGRVRYVIGRFAADYRRPLAWGAAFRHEIPHTLLIEGAVHHFDQIRNLSGANCATIAGVDWLPAGADSFKGECLGLFVMRMTNGVMAQYEGTCLAAGKQQTWHEEFYRIECEGGALVTDGGDRVWIEEHTPGSGVRTEDVPLVHVEWPGHQAMIAQFVAWLDGGEPPPTVIEDNMQTTAMLFGAITASTENRTVDIQAMIADATRG
jgi:predicted dehydrogenase